MLPRAMMKKPLCQHKSKLLFIVPSLRRAGAETQVVDLLNGLDERRFEIHLFTFVNRLDQLPRVDHAKVRFYNRLRTSKLDFSIVKSILDIIVNEQIDIVHCTLQISLLFAWLATRLCRRKPRLVAAIHTTISPSLKDSFFDRTLYRQLLNACDCIIFVSENQKQYWTRKNHSLHKKAAVIYNGIDVSYFDPEIFKKDRKHLRRSLHLPIDAKVACCLAGFRIEKRHDVLVEAFRRVQPHAYLLLAGDGQTKKHIEALVHENGLTERVRFLGEVKDVRPVLAASDVSVLASTSETFPLAVLESMSMSVPVIATNTGGLPEAIVLSKTGELVPPDDPIALAKALSTMLSKGPELMEMGALCRKHVAKVFRKDQMIVKTQNLLYDLTQRRHNFGNLSLGD